VSAALPPEPRDDDLRAALLSLPVRQRTAIVLRFYEDLSEHQTADAMGTSGAAVKSLVARGMETLRNEITREERSTGGGS
jgi:RNA polymerase sigma factor (sigma-70 family)